VLVGVARPDLIGLPSLCACSAIPRGTRDRVGGRLVSGVEGKGVRLAVEFRHPSWVEPANLEHVKELLSTYSVS